MARKVNFDYERRQKEMRKQKKRQEKLDAKRARRSPATLRPPISSRPTTSSIRQRRETAAPSVPDAVIRDRLAPPDALRIG